ncbi:hypothetical protein C474_19544 [Halogeometricum pallidum JCM 14848]|uniref:Glycerophosphoryl diester phosphodiesterase membrane domain-containing protein n=1 Tax=Halogeometricum pallidum JCM 14848 TaxID=1227487 RepID=M0CTU0_HALPD|nr:hypothetical protein [Halogeometricum pallidum]ELZ26626.1 hypothetical protein C474_19544 [Halogeometricum pallidum JCM 14848]
MSWHAIDALDDARASTTDLLLPFDLGTWLRLALLAPFVGAGASNASVNANAGGTVTPGFGSVSFPVEGLPPVDPSALPDVGALAYGVAAVVAAFLVLALAFWLVSAAMEFVLVTGLVDRSVRIRAPFRAHLGNGLRLWAFEACVGLLALLTVGVPAVLVVLGGVAVGPGLLLALLPVLLLGVAVAFLVALLFRLATDFVVPAMLTEGCGVIDGWRRVLPTLRAEWEEFALYLLVRLTLSVLVGALVAAGTLFVAVLVALPFAVLGGAVLFAFSGSGVGALPLLAWVLLAIVGACYLVVVAAASAVLLVPVVTFFRYYSLSLLGRVDEELDLVGAAVREMDDGEDEGGDGGNGPGAATA